MLDLAKIQSIAQSYSPQELFAALVWQRRFNEFDGEEVITDLSNHRNLWASFLFTKPIFAPDENGLSFGGMVDTLLAMALTVNYLTEDDAYEKVQPLWSIYLKIAVKCALLSSELNHLKLPLTVKLSAKLGGG
ncbi:hypothetical protein [Nostoc sp.]|uniref:hypothetical protein n=1 Tax=Nostoc sp. TaxID=1180 RepID=UPI002FF72729